MRLSLKLSLSMGFMALLLCAIGLFSLYQMREVNQISTEISSSWLPSVEKVQRLNTLASDYRIQEIMYVFSPETREMRARQMGELQRSFDACDKEYRQLISSPEEQAYYDAFLSQWKAYMAAHEEIVSLVGQGREKEASEVLRTRSKQTFDAAGATLDKDVELNVQGGKTAGERGNRLYAEAGNTIAAALIIALLLAGGLAWFIVRGVLRQLGKDPGALEVIARRVTDGDYAVDDGSPRIGVYGNLLSMVEALKTHIDNARQESQRAAEESENARKAMQEAENARFAAEQAKREGMLDAARQLENIVGVVSSASTQLSTQIEQSERGSSAQAERVAETATAMEEMNATVLEVARNAGKASDISLGTKEKAAEGAAVVRDAVESIRQVQRESLALKEDMSALSEQARAISQIMAVISDIADQTNLLALNAAIEAARAGDAGRGFAVVADEVRKLAEKTMASTTDVGDAIKAIQQSAEKSAAQVDRAVRAIEEATGHAGRSGETLTRIVSMADAAADQVRGIAAASEQQSASSEEINHSLAQISAIAGETARAMREAAGAVADLAAQARALGALIADMKRG